MSATRPALRALSDRLGILAGYRDVEGRERTTSDATREALVAAMGFDASDEAAASRTLSALTREDRERLVEPVHVWREGAGGDPVLRVGAEAARAGREFALELRLEDGRRERVEGSLPQAGPDGARALALPLRPPEGYHEVRLALGGPEGERRAAQQLVVAPHRLLQPEEVLGRGRAFGIAANLYSVRGSGDWGHGGLRELAALGRLAGDAGAAFVGINPLHAVPNRGLEFSPYGPSSRLYRNVLYLDPEAVPELAESPAARALLADPALRARRGALEADARIDHEAVLDAMLPVLRELHRSFRRAGSAERRRAYAAYREREGAALRDFATWEVLSAYHTGDGSGPGTAWWRWPRAHRDPRGAAVRDFRDAHAEEVDFRCWLQFELDRQLGEADVAVRDAGCALGVYGDLALGSSRASADTWMAQDLFAEGVHAGAPPDAYAPEGQDWGLPPFDPHRLRRDAYRPWSRLLGASLAHAGVLRIDHAMGLMRLFWIPEGRSGAEGAYVTYPLEDLLGVLSLESRRHRTVVVAEDLGTVPPDLPARLEDWGLLRSAVVYFERDGDRFRPAARYPARALASVQTHDLAPLAGYFEGTDLALRRRAAGQGADADPAAARAERRAERAALVDALRQEGLLPDVGEVDDATLRDAVHAFLAATPSVLVSVALDDLAGEREPVNVPGLPLAAHRSWSRRMAASLEALRRSPEVAAALRPLAPRRLPSPR